MVYQFLVSRLFNKVKRHQVQKPNLDLLTLQSINPKSFRILNVHNVVPNNVHKFEPCFFFTNLQSDFGGVQREGEQVSYTSCCAGTNELHSRGGWNI